MQAKKGFTIIELVVVISIIGILAVIIMSNVVQYIAEAKDAAALADLKQLSAPAAAYYAENGNYGDPNDPSNTGFCNSPDSQKIKTAVDAIDSTNYKYYCYDANGSLIGKSNDNSWIVHADILPPTCSPDEFVAVVQNASGACTCESRSAGTVTKAIKLKNPAKVAISSHSNPAIKIATENIFGTKIVLTQYNGCYYDNFSGGCNYNSGGSGDYSDYYCQTPCPSPTPTATPYPDGTYCYNNSDCQSQCCSNNYCGEDCSTETPTPTPTPAGSGGSCSFDTDCSNGLCCNTGTCGDCPSSSSQPSSSTLPIGLPVQGFSTANCPTTESGCACPSS